MDDVFSPSNPIDVLLDARASFTPRPSPIPPELRPNWRVALLLLIVQSCRQHKATWGQLHVLNWAVRTRRGRSAFERAVNQMSVPEDTVIRFEPSLDRAVDLAIGLGLLRWEGGRLLELTEDGRGVLDLLGQHQLMSKEREFLDSFRGRLTQTLVARLTGIR
jgi:hypothetical protein